MTLKLKKSRGVLIATAAASLMAVAGTSSAMAIEIPAGDTPDAPAASVVVDQVTNTGLVSRHIPELTTGAVAADSQLSDTDLVSNHLPVVAKPPVAEDPVVVAPPVIDTTGVVSLPTDKIDAPAPPASQRAAACPAGVRTISVKVNHTSITAPPGGGSHVTL